MPAQPIAAPRGAARPRRPGPGRDDGRARAGRARLDAVAVAGRAARRAVDRAAAARASVRRAATSPTPGRDADLVVDRHARRARSTPPPRALAPSAARRRAGDPPLGRVPLEGSTRSRRRPDVGPARCTRCRRSRSSSSAWPARRLVVRGRRRRRGRATSRVSLGLRPFRVADADRAAYHAAACIASNHLVALLAQVDARRRAAGCRSRRSSRWCGRRVENVADARRRGRAHRPGRARRRRDTCARTSTRSRPTSATRTARCAAGARLSGRDDAGAAASCSTAVD